MTDANTSQKTKVAGRSKTNPRENLQGKVCYVDVFKLTDLPEIMDKKGWGIAPILMRKWFSSPAREMTKEEKGGETDSRLYPPALVDTTTVTMAWALSFPRIKEEYDKIFGSKGFFRSNPPRYESEAAKALLIKRLRKAGKFTMDKESFGNLTEFSTQDIDETWQFQFYPLDISYFDYEQVFEEDLVMGDPALDDMWGALANFTFKIAGKGTVTPRMKMPEKKMVDGYDVSVSEICVYIRDTYDFNDKEGEDQRLGYWSKTSYPYVRVYAFGESRGSCPDDYVSVSNGKFREYRTKTQKGGDLLVFSDVLVTPLKKPFTFWVPRSKAL
jgi:hypothetical protein